MSIRPIDYAMVQRTADVESVKHREETKPMTEQQNMQVQVEHREDKLRHQVLDPKNSDQAKNDADARDEGKNKYSARDTDKRRGKAQKDGGRVVRKQNSGFDIKI